MTARVQLQEAPQQQRELARLQAKGLLVQAQQPS
jgi:hypothetical protein